MEAELTGPVSNMWQTLMQKASTSVLPEKAIVFSQFLEHINVIEAQVRHPECRIVQCVILVIIMDVDAQKLDYQIIGVGRPLSPQLGCVVVRRWIT